MKNFKDRCVALRKRDYSLTEIVKITGLPKSSVYEYVRGMPLSHRRMRSILRARTARIRKYALLRRGISARKFHTFEKWDIAAVRFISHLLFDGEIRQAHCTYNNRNKALIELVQQSVSRFYTYEPKRYFNQQTGVWRISYFNVAFSTYIKSKARKLLKEMHSLPRELKREFLRSFFDDEGCMDFRPHRNHRRIRGYQKDISILQIVRKLLLEFRITSRIQRPNEIVIVGKENFRRFETEIGFSRGVYINGNRSNSIWKRSLEKRELLRRAIESYKPIGSNGVHRSTPSNAKDSRKIANGPT